MQMRFDLYLLADQIAAIIRQEEEQLRLEQAVYGIDARDELALQGMLADNLARDYEVKREVHYPSMSNAKATQRRRCDLVITPRGFPLRIETTAPTLFDSPTFSTAGDALWLEVKCAYQFREGGIRHGGYGQQWRSAVVEDLRKMEADEQIKEAALVLLVFNESEEILQKDLELFEIVLAEKEVLAGSRQVRSVKITERIGHHLCTVALWPTIQR